MADFRFYSEVYLGGSILAEDFPRLAARAVEQLSRYGRLYRVTGDEIARNKAVCAMADALYYFETEQNAPQSASVGSVSESRGVVDVSSKAQERELYRCAGLYLDIYRGVGR